MYSTLSKLLLSFLDITGEVSEQLWWHLIEQINNIGDSGPWGNIWTCLLGNMKARKIDSPCLGVILTFTDTHLF